MAEKKSAGLSNYRTNIRANVRALWRGEWTYDQWYDQMLSTIKNGLTRAWYEGAKECGIKPSELSYEENNALAAAYFSQYDHLDSLGDAIEANSKANEGKITPLIRRSDMWVNAYRATVTQAQTMSCRDKKARWDLGPTKEHCVDCAKYAGRVYRMSTWDRYGIHPQSTGLACGGIWNCKCFFTVTDEPCTPGRPPRMTGQGGT